MGFKVVLATTEPIETIGFNCSAIRCEYNKPHSFVDILSLFGVSLSFPELRAFSYEPGNWAGSVTWTNSVVPCSYGKFSPVDQDEFKKHNQNGGT